MVAGFFVQSTAVLFRDVPSIDRLARALEGFSPEARHSAGGSKYMRAGEWLWIPYRPDLAGAIAVDVFDGTWPDGMGSPTEEPELFAAWSMGFFGPFAFPGALERAVAFPSGMQDPSRAVSAHRSVVRIQLTYATGAADAVLFPEGRDAVDELVFVTNVARALLDDPDALCCFNANGETLFTAESMDAALASADAQAVLPTNLWVNVRKFEVPGSKGFAFFDTIGAEQLEREDHEACFLPDRFTGGEVFQFLHNSIGYVATHGSVIADGHTLSGPRDSQWLAHGFEESLAPRPRPARRFRPLDGSVPPEVFGFPARQSEKSSLWSRWFKRS